MTSMICTTEAGSGHRRWRLLPFQPLHAGTIAGWAPTDEALRWLAPGTLPPLTPEKVLAWIKPRTRAYVLSAERPSRLSGYGELNPMPDDPRHWWLGHLVVAPDERGRGLGGLLVTRLLGVALRRYGATRISLIVFRDNQRARQCYERAGFDPIGEEVHRFSALKEPATLIRYEWRQ